MSNIQGSKSKFYVKDAIPNISESIDTLKYATAQEVVGARVAMDTMNHGIFLQTTGLSVGASSVKRLIHSPGHNAKYGDIMRPTSGNSMDEEIAIIKIVDANFFVIAYEADLAVADTFEILRSVTPRYDSNGGLFVNASGPAQFIKDTVTTTVEEDTAVPANNNAFPSKLFIQKDGVTYPVNKDTGTPANTVSVPVEIVAASGTPINITAGDLNVQLTDLGANFDRTRIGDGVEQLEINADGSINAVVTANDLDIRNLNFATDSVSTVAQVQTGTFAEDLTSSTTPETFIAPAGAFACFIETDETNTTNSRVVMGGVSSTTSGIQFQPGRSEFYQGGSDVSYCMESGTGKISIQWFVRA